MCRGTRRSARTARRLQEEFELSAAAIALALALMDRVEKLEKEVSQLRCQLPK